MEIDKFKKEFEMLNNTGAIELLRDFNYLEQVCTREIEKCGLEECLAGCIEEHSELIQALTKYVRYVILKNSPNEIVSNIRYNFIEEVADVVYTTMLVLIGIYKKYAKFEQHKTLLKHVYELFLDFHLVDNEPTDIPDKECILSTIKWTLGAQSNLMESIICNQDEIEEYHLYSCVYYAENLIKQLIRLCSLVFFTNEVDILKSIYIKLVAADFI